MPAWKYPHRIKIGIEKTTGYYTILDQIKKQNKELIKKIALGAFCVIVILLMIFGLLSGMFKGNDQDTSSQAIALFFR